MNANIWNTIFSSGFYMPSNTLAPFLGLAGAPAAGDAVGQAASGVVVKALAPAGGLGGLGSAAPAPLAGPLASTLGGTPMIPPAAMAAEMPGMPLGNVAGQPYGRALPQYGFRPTFVARPPAAG